ncbi:MAG: PD-(D/E)XK nuclease family protein [Clostridia bacterium]|nr:PD-(D/E)XK nuclease family protein [Bacteroidales bacterium]MBR3918604.1 PD-(D/E)XK nuclease family protein [Clostridia bacterium]MBR6067712.1 PD-(D/E)XK nuclease family protein [Bacteroidales bacterium]
MEKEKIAPWWLSHKPIISVDYEENDAYAGDAKFLSLGHASWNEEDYSAKIWRYSGERWSRQSEEMPIWRVLDLATLIVAKISGKESYLNEFVQDPQGIDGLSDYLNENMELYAPRINELRRLLTTDSIKKTSDCIPNIFNFATSELSQDAVFAWLIQWADPKYKDRDEKLFAIAQNFVKLLLGENDYAISSINVGRQWNNIDIWVEINDDTFLVIEDKTNTSIHDNQLERYKNAVEKEYEGKRNKLYYAYVKTGNEPLSILRKIEQTGYRTISRIDLINCLDMYSGCDTIVLSYLKSIKGIEAKTQSYRNMPVKNWEWYAWQGFYLELDRILCFKSWEYVSNPAGGFLGAWWHFTKIKNGEMYLQFEEQKLCFKLSCNVDNRSDFRWEWYNKLISTAERMGHPEIVKPQRFGAGCYMTIAVVDPDYLFGTSKINIDDIVMKLKQYQEIVDICCKE